MSLTNPAGRLHAVLSAASAKRSGSPAIDVWTEVFNVPKTPRQLLFARIAVLAGLVGEVRTLVENLPDTENPEFLLRQYDQVEKTVTNFAVLGNLTMQQFMEPLTDAGLEKVETAALAMRRSGYREPHLEQAKLDELRDEVHDLISDVLGADGLTPDEKRTVVAHLRAVEEALTNAFLGNDVTHATHGLLGGLLTLRPRATENQAIRQVAKFAGAVMAAVTVNLATQAVENAIEPPKPLPALVLIERIAHGEDIPAITSGHAPDDVVDAELVEDGSPT